MLSSFSQKGMIEGEHMQEWFDSVGKKFVLAFVEGDRWKLYFKGLGVTLGIRKEFCRCVLLHDPAFIHKQYLRTYFSGKSHLMGNNYHGHTRFCQLLHNSQNLSYHLRIQC